MKKKILKIILLILFAISISGPVLANDLCYWKTAALSKSKEGDTPYCPEGTHSALDNTKCSGKGLSDQMCCCQTIDTASTTPRFKLPDYVFQIPIGKLSTLTAVDCSEGSCEIPWIAQYIQALYNYGLTISSVIAVLTLMAAGLLWIVSGGDSSKISKARQMIVGSVTGLLLLVSMNLFLTYINPNLVSLKPLTIDFIKKIESINSYEIEGCVGKWATDQITGNQFSQKVVDAINKVSADRNIDPCYYYAILSQESRGKENAFADDRQVANCDITARKKYICSLYSNCCGKECSDAKCKTLVEDSSIAPKKDLSALDLSGAASYGFGLGQITYRGPDTTPLCDGGKGFYYTSDHKKCYHFDDLLTAEVNLQAMSDGISSYYCKKAVNNGQPDLDCFKKYAGSGAWATCTGNKKMAVYQKCKTDGFSNIANKSWTITQK